jgi:hypothetical protein
MRGLWEAGDWLHEWPAVRVKSANDGDVAQAGTTRRMARLVGLIATGQILEPASCKDMMERLKKAAKGVDHPWIGRPTPPIIRKDCIQANKMGQRDLKVGGFVDSEVSVLDAPLKPEHRYVVAWQNLPAVEFPITFADVATVIRDTIMAYEA